MSDHMGWLKYLLLGILVEYASGNLDKRAAGRSLSFGVLWARAEEAHGAQIAMSDMENALAMLVPLIENVSGELYGFCLVRKDYVA